jgi:hypothetical protein
MIRMTTISLDVVPAALDSNSVVAIAPGPAISGIANGKTAISEMLGHRLVGFARLVVRPVAEDHPVGDGEQKKSARDPKSWNADPKLTQQPVPA